MDSSAIPFVDGAGSARLARVGVDEVNSPPQWQRLILKLTVLYYVRGVVVQGVVTELGELGSDVLPNSPTVWVLAGLSQASTMSSNSRSVQIRPP